ADSIDIKEISKMKSREEELGLTKDEVAFYDALTDDDAVKDFIDEKVLKQMAHELTETIRRSLTIDWSIKKSAQAGMRKIVKRLLRKYKYPPEQAKKALDTVIRQAELMCGNVSVEDLQNDKCGYSLVAEEKEGYDA
ncbi:MAG: DUF3387 domain-containing protein, partial [Klebsiella sp.]|nr:DUF3387 domain-containing protein [Klebsiella sp.]